MTVQKVEGRAKKFTSNAALAQYRRVKLVSAGTVGYAGAVDMSIGTTRNDVDASGRRIAVELSNLEGTVTMTAAGAIAVNSLVYGAADGKVDDIDNGNLEGVALEAATGDGSLIEVLPIAAKPTASLGPQSGAMVAASAALAASSTETTLGTFAIPAGGLNAGDIIRVRAQLIATATNSTDTLTMRLKIGTVTVVAPTAVDVADNDIGYIDCDIVVRTAGASGTIVAAGVQGLGVPATVTAKPFLKASATLDTTAACDITFTGQFSTTGANSCRLDILNVNIIRA